MPMSDYLEGKLLRHTFRNEPYTPPETVWLALYTTAPQADGNGGAEVNGTGYVRRQLSMNVTEGAPSLATLSEVVEYPVAETDWGTITTGVIFDAQAGGNVLTFDPFTDPNNPDTPLPKPITTGDIVRIVAGNLSVRLGAISDFE